MRHELNGRRRLARLRLVLGHGLIFAAAGPALGTLLSPGVILLPFAVIISYLTSTPAALLAGLLTGLAALHACSEIRLMLVSTSIGAVCGMLVPACLTMASHARLDGAAGILTLYAIDGAFAAAVCTRMTRSLRLAYIAAPT